MGEPSASGFAALANETGYPLARELMVRAVCEAEYEGATWQELLALAGRFHGAVAAQRHLADELSGRDQLELLDAACFSSALIDMAHCARAGIGRG